MKKILNSFLTINFIVLLLFNTWLIYNNKDANDITHILLVCFTFLNILVCSILYGNSKESEKEVKSDWFSLPITVSDDSTLNKWKNLKIIGRKSDILYAISGRDKDKDRAIIRLTDLMEFQTEIPFNTLKNLIDDGD